MPKYTRQIVAFVDILGIKSMLPAFEQEALNNSEAGSSNYHESAELNMLLEIFRNSLSLIREAECNYYVFSDNICITIEYLADDSEKPNLFIEILILISRLTNHYAKKGYFLRGAVDVGWFLSFPDIAIGVPLARAYYLESKKAIFPRVLVSKDFNDLLMEYKESQRISEELIGYSDLYVKNGSDFRYVNPFYYIIQHENKDSKIEFLREYSDNINTQLSNLSHNRRVRRKYRWLAGQFNSFLNEYLANSAYKEVDDPDLDFDEQEIKMIKELKIQTQILPRWLTNIFPVFG